MEGSGDENGPKQCETRRLGPLVHVSIVTINFFGVLEELNENFDYYLVE
jgi:hypothetical protein